MSAQPSLTQHGYLVLADISGFTAYLAGTELEHAHEIMTELLELLVGRLTPMLTLSKLEGDAVFAYAPEARFSRGEALLELVEATYVAFKDRLEGMHRRTTCECNACRSIPTLDLKFMTHHGAYIVQTVAGIHELVGSDVNLAHRLMKNHVAEATGWRAYALFTGKSLERLGLKLEGAHAQPEAYEHLGEVQTYNLNLKARYQEITEARRVFVSAEEADFVLIQEFPAPPPIVWDWLNDPQKRNIWAEGHVVWTAGLRPGGRSGVGARNHCDHGKGKGVAVETIVDWRPFDYMTAETLDRGMVFLETFQLEALPDGRGTRLHDRIRVRAPLPRWLRRPMMNFMMNTMMKYDAMMANSARLLGEVVARERAGETPATEAA
jgi:hypothetical protein